MAASMQKCCLNLIRNKKAYLISCRGYTIEPPEWMGGKNILTRTGHYDYPKYSDTFQTRIAKLRSSDGVIDHETKNIGVEIPNVASNRNEYLKVIVENKKNKSLEQLARLKKLEIPLSDVKLEWARDSRAQQTKILADHYGIYRDLFDGDYFVPVVDVRIQFDFDEEYVTPVHRGNCILPSDSKTAPTVEYESASDVLWTLLMTNPDGHLTDSNAEYVHWLVGNIPGNDVSSGEVLVDYIQPFPAKGTGFHRHVFILFEQKERIDYSKWKKQTPCHNIQDRTFRTAQFFDGHRNALTPKGLSFFQSQWDESVRDIYHKVFDIEEPTFEYAFAPPYHPPPIKYPHKQPFDRYFDRYRDKKDLAEEVLRMKLKNLSPFSAPPPGDKYALVHHRPKIYKPSWLKLREELMLRRVEQYKDLS